MANLVARPNLNTVHFATKTTRTTIMFSTLRHNVTQYVNSIGPNLPFNPDPTATICYSPPCTPPSRPLRSSHRLLVRLTPFVRCSLKATLQPQSNSGPLALAGALACPPLILFAGSWASRYLSDLNRGAFLLVALGASVAFGGMCFSRFLKKWPSLDYLMLPYLIALPLMLLIGGLFFSAYVLGDGL